MLMFLMRLLLMFEAGWWNLLISFHLRSFLFYFFIKMTKIRGWEFYYCEFSWFRQYFSWILQKILLNSTKIGLNSTKIVLNSRKFFAEFYKNCAEFYTKLCWILQKIRLNSTKIVLNLTKIYPISTKKLSILDFIRISSNTFFSI